MSQTQVGEPGTIRAYDKSVDLEHVQRIWREVGWVSGDDDAAHVETFFDAGWSLVYIHDGAAESVSHITRGSIRHGDADLVMAAVTAVTTSHIARRQGAARRLLARMLAEEAANGAHVASLGIFDQGFYDMLGFGTGAYDHRFDFDPSLLQVDVPYRTPVRLSLDDYADVHACMSGRLRSHGGVVLDDPLVVKAELGWMEQRFALGYRDADGTLTHFVAGSAKDENGPYRIHAYAYQDISQLKELLSLLHSLGDQVITVAMGEPAHLQLQDLLRTPFRDGIKVRQSPSHKSAAWWQLRILDLPTCVSSASFPGPDVTFNLRLSDPIAAHLSGETDWDGVGGDYVVTFGETSSCEPGTQPGLPRLEAGVGPFTRLWFGVRPASVLAATTDLSGDPELLAALDRTVRTPVPVLGWDF